jgi:hypothetical protein
MTQPLHGEYCLSFTAASLRPELMSKVAEIYLEQGSWEVTKKEVLAHNALQCRSSTSAGRLERELRGRLRLLTPDQLQLMQSSTRDVRICMAWLAAVKRAGFLYQYAAEVLREKIRLHDPVLRISDYKSFIEEKTGQHHELAAMTEMTLGKIRRVLFRMVKEVGLLTPGADLGTITRPIVPQLAEEAIRNDDPRWLAAFLFTDREISLN